MYTFVYIRDRHFLIIYFDEQSDLSLDGPPRSERAVVNDSAVMLLTFPTTHCRPRRDRSPLYLCEKTVELFLQSL